MGEPVKIPILGVGRFAGLNREYSVEYSIGSASANSGSTWKGNMLGNILRRGWRRGLTARIWRAWTTLVVYLWSAWLRVVQQCRIFKRRVWITSVSDQPDFYGSEFVWMSSTLWKDQNLFLTTLKNSDISQKTLLFFWWTGLWYQLLVGGTTGGGFETLGGDKTHCFI